MVKKLLFSFVFSISFYFGFSQTVLIDPVTVGGFESGTTFASNGWSSTTGSSNPLNHWVCNTGATSGFSGSHCAYIIRNTNNNPPSHDYKVDKKRVSHFYRSITIPAGETNISLSFLWIANGEAGFDYLKVWKVPNSYTPSYNTEIVAGTDNIDLTGELQGISSWQTNTFTLPSNLAGTTFKLVFEWRNDESAGNNPPAGVDNISLTSLTCSPYSGTLTVGPTGTFSSLTTAITQLVNCGMSSHVVLELQSTYTSSGETFPIEFPTTLPTDATHTLTVRPASGASPTITGSVSGLAIIEILNSYVTIDGSNNGTTSRNLTLTNTNTSSPYVVMMGSTTTTPVSYITLKNCTITNGSQSGYAAVLINDDSYTGGAYFNNISIQNNLIQKSQSGISVTAYATSGNGNGLLITDNDLNATGIDAIRTTGIYLQAVDGATVSGNEITNIDGADDELDFALWLASGTVNTAITNNTIGAMHYTGGGVAGSLGIYVTTNTANSNVSITGNTISDITSNNDRSDYVCGIDVIFDTGGITIANNQISNIKNTNTSGYSAVGILLESALTSANVTVQNNFVYDIAGYGYNSQTQDNGYGIQVLSGGGYKLYHNSVSLATNQTSASSYPAALMISSGVTQAAALDVRNNIFSIPATVGTNRYAVLCDAPKTVFSQMDYNIYYTSGSNLAYIGSNRTTLVDMILGFGNNTHIASELPNFVSASNLHLTVPGTASAIESGGVAISGLTTDIDGDTRPNGTAPDIGADEYGGIAIGEISISSNQGSTLCNGNSTILTANSTTSYSYVWTPSTGLSSTTGVSVTATPSVDTTYYTMGTYTGITKIALIQLTVGAAPTSVTLTNPDAIVCSESIQALTASGGNLTGFSQTFDSGIVNATIPDVDLTTGFAQTYSISSIPTGATLTKIEVLVNISHTWDDDLVFNLEAPNGQIVNLMDERGGSGNNFTNTRITSDASAASFTTGSPPFTGTYTADLETAFNAGTTLPVTTQTFSDLFSVSNGNWIVRVYDDVSGDIGTFINGSITLYYDVNNAITWEASPALPNTLFSDAAATVPYVPGTYATTVYAKPIATSIYTAKATNGGCTNDDLVTFTIQSTTWNGTTWSETLSSNQSIHIMDDYDVNADLNACSCTIDSGKILLVKANQTLTVQNQINNEGIIEIEHEGSLVQINETDANTGSGLFRVHKTTGTYKNYDYFYWSSPVENETVGTVLPTVNYKYKFNPANYLDVKSGHGYPQPTASIPGDGYDDNGDDWSYLSNATIMPKGIGFIAMGEDSPTNFNVGQMGVSQAAFNVTFEGEKIHNGTFTAQVYQDAYTPSFNANNNNLNLLGNPFPSAIDVYELYHDNASVLEGKFYFWTHDAQLAAISGPNTYDFNNNNFAIGAVTGTYPSYTYTQTLSGTGKSAPRYIASTQGFMASALDGIASPSTVTYKNSMRATGNNNTFLRQASDLPQVSRLWLNMTGVSSFNQIAVGFDTSTTDAYGMGDAPRVASAADTDFYSIIPEVTGAFAIQFLSDFQDDKMVPLGISVWHQGTFEITLDHVEGVFNEGQIIYLEDTYLDIIHNLSEGAYPFTQTAGANINDRFILRFTNTALGNDDTALNTVKVYPNPSTGVFNVSYQGSATLQYTVYDLTGKTILSGTGNQIDLSHQAIGMYFATITDGSAVRSLKLVRE